MIRVINIPQGKDPDEFLRNKGENAHNAFKNVIEQSGNDVEYRISKFKSKYNLEVTEDKVAYLNEIVKILVTIDNEIEQDIYISKIAKEVGVSPEAIKTRISKLSRRQYTAMIRSITRGIKNPASIQRKRV